MLCALPPVFFLLLFFWVILFLMIFVDYLSNNSFSNVFVIGFYRWWQHWIEYANQDQPNNANDGSSLLDHGDLVGSSSLKRPAGIDNSDLIYDATSDDCTVGIEIHDTLLEGRDYVLLPQEVWNQLYSW